MENEFEKLQEWLVEEKQNENLHDGAEIELAYQINKEQKLVTPGIQIMTNSFDSPLFISMSELITAAKLSEEMVKKLIEPSSGE